MYQKGVQHNPTYWNGVRHNTTYRKGVQWAWVPLTSSCKRRATSKLEIDNEIEVIDLEEEATVRVADGDLIFSSGMWNLADGMFPTAKRLVPELLDACPVKTMRAFFESPGAIWMLIGVISIQVFEAHNLIYFHEAVKDLMPGRPYFYFWYFSPICHLIN